MKGGSFCWTYGILSLANKHVDLIMENPSAVNGLLFGWPLVDSGVVQRFFTAIVPYTGQSSRYPPRFLSASTAM